MRTDKTSTASIDDYINAKPFSSIPGPRKYYKNDFTTLLNNLRNEYGDLFILPGMFGGPNILATYKPDHFEKIFRTEGQWPYRASFKTMEYYRAKVRPDIYGKHLGLALTQGKAWADMRSAVNPVMMQPKITKMYIPRIDTVAKEFVVRIRQIRDPLTNQTPDNFEDELNRWSLESIVLIAMDTRLGLVSNERNERAAKLLQAEKSFVDLFFEVEFKPALWRIIPTPDFKKIMQAYDTITTISDEIVEENRVKLENSLKHSEDEQSVFQKLLQIDPQLAKVTAIDLLFGGADTTTSTLAALLYILAKNPDKQEKLRDEIMTILPQKDSPLTSENMSNLPYLRACIKESFRTYPIAIGNSRNAGQNLTLDGYQIPKGTIVMMGTNEVQQEEKYYPNAGKFEPERWLRTKDAPASGKSNHPFTFLPFGFGPRMCIGKRFAELEIETLVARIIRNFQIEWKHPDLKFITKTIRVPAGKLLFTLRDI